VAQLDPNFDPLFQRGYDPAVHRTKVTAVEQPADTPAALEEPEPEHLGTTLPLDAIPRRNPFLTILPVLGGVTIAIAGWFLYLWVQAYQNQFNGPMRTDDSAMMIVAPALMPGMLVTGLLSITLWLVLLTLLPRRADA
jgi:hypothetical protein